MVLGCFEFLILLGVIIVLARLLRRRDLRWLGHKCLSFLRRVRRLSGTKLILAALVIGLLFALGLAAVEGRPNTLSTEIVLLPLFWSAIALFLWGLVRLVLGLLFRDVPRMDCPPLGLLKDLLAERLPSGEQARLASHLEVCMACQHRVEGLTAGQKSWPGVARKLSEHSPAPEPALRKVMDRLKESNDEATGDESEFCGDLPLGFLSPSDKPGQLGGLERYEVLEEIGRGGMGVVLKAFDPSLHRVVAIKVLAPQLATSGVARKRFLREAKAAAAVTHDHIVTIHAVDEANGLPYLVMQYVAGLSLQDRLDKDGPLELPDILRIGMQTASGLAAAHAHGIVHRDVKPANILLEEGIGRVKLTDFGLARAMDDASLTQSGFVAGSPLYMAPEQARGEALDHRADLFSLGSVLYTMCTGRPPFRAANTLAVLRRVSEDSPRPIRETNPEVPDWLAAIVDKLLAKHPNERFGSAAEVVEVLGRHLAELQNVGWTPPAASNVEAGLPTSVTLCPTCGASLHVPEAMVGTIVHCAECGKPFHVEEGSAVIQVARPMKPPLGPGFRLRQRKRGRWVWVACGCAILLIFIVFLWFSYRPDSGRHSSATASSELTEDDFPHRSWKDELNGLPADATFFEAIDLKDWESLTLDDAPTQAFLHAVLPAKTADTLTPENLGRIKINGIALGYYEGPKPEDAHAIVHLRGTALDGRKRIVEYVRRAAGKVQIEEGSKNSRGIGPILLSSPDLPFALQIIDDHYAYLAASLSRDAKASQHRKILEKVPSSMSIPTGYNPPWVWAVLNDVPRDACGLFLGEIPAGLRKLLTETLQLRACPRSFVCHLKREGDGIALSLTLNVDKAGAERTLAEDLEKWRRHALGDLQYKYPALRKQRQSLAQVGQILNTMRWEANSGSVRTQVRISGASWKALLALVKQASRP